MARPEVPNDLPQPASVVAGLFHAPPAFDGTRAAGARDWLLVQARRGAGTIDGITVDPRGPLVLCRPGTALRYRADVDARDWSLLWVHFTPRSDWLKLLDWPELTADGLMGLTLTGHGTLAQLIARRLDDVCRFSVSPYVHREVLAGNALEEVLLWCDSINPRGDDATVNVDPRVMATTEWLGQNLREPVTLDRLAQVIGMSVSRMAHLFRDQMGMPPLQYLEQQRMRRARDLLAVTGFTIRQVAAEVGFEDPFYFTSRFRRAHGVTPATYRDRLGVRDLPPEDPDVPGDGPAEADGVPDVVSQADR